MTVSVILKLKMILLTDHVFKLFMEISLYFGVFGQATHSKLYTAMLTVM